MNQEVIDQQPPTVETPEQEVKKEATRLIPVEAGHLMPQDHVQLMTVLGQISEGGGFPERFKTRPQRMAAYIMATGLMGKDQWQLAVNNMAIIKNQLSIYGELPGTLAERTGEVKEKKVYLITREYTEICTANKNLDAEAWAGVCRVQRKGREPKEFFYTMDDARKAGQYPPMKPEYKNKQRTGKMIPNEDSPWEKFTKVMLMRKAMALAVKFEFPEALIGVPIAEYDFEQAPDLIKDVTPQENRAERLQSLNNKFTEVPVGQDNASQ